MDSKKTGTRGKGLQSFTARDAVVFLFRQRRAAAIAFLVIFVVVTSSALLLSQRYTAQMLILVESGERADAAVSAGPNAPSDARGSVTEAEMDSQVALLQSRALLDEVVVECGLDQPKHSLWNSLFGNSEGSRNARISIAARRLASNLDIQIPKLSNVVSVSYSSSDPELAARVLNSLGDGYLKLNAAVHRPSGAGAFFEQEQSKYQTALRSAEDQLVRFTHDQGVVSAALEVNAALQHLSDFQGMETQTQIDIAQTRQRIRALDAEEKEISPRVTTQIRTSDNGQLIQGLRTTLLSLELKRTDLLEKFAPDYRPVKEVETQIEQTKAALASAERSPLRDSTTDRDPRFDLVDESLTTARAELAGLQARATALGGAVAHYQQKAEWTQQQGVTQQDLMRKIKAAEENYVLFQNKYEEAQISDALDTHRILNVRVAEAAAIPALPNHSRLWYVLIAGLIAALGAVGLAFILDNLDPTFRNPDEVESFLNVPVMASMVAESGRRNGHNHTNGNHGTNGNGSVQTYVS